jgi:hypothetical protein
VSHIVGSNRSQLAGFERDDRGGVTVERNELDFIRFAVGIAVDHCADIASHQTGGWLIGQQDHAIMFGNHGFTPATVG